MKAIKLTVDWNADPNAPELNLSVNSSNVVLDFFVNYFKFEQFKENDKARIIFKNCHKYSLSSINDEGYFSGQHRYKYTDLPFGEFYQLDTNWQIDFPGEYSLLSSIGDAGNLHHYIFLFKENVFECVAESYSVEFYSEL